MGTSLPDAPPRRGLVLAMHEGQSTFIGKQFGNDGVDYSVEDSAHFPECTAQFLRLKSPVAVQFRKIFYYIGIHGSRQGEGYVSPTENGSAGVCTLEQFIPIFKPRYIQSKKPAIFMCACWVGDDVFKGFAARLSRTLRIPVLAADLPVYQLLGNPYPSVEPPAHDSSNNSFESKGLKLTTKTNSEKDLKLTQLSQSGHDSKPMKEAQSNIDYRSFKGTGSSGHHWRLLFPNQDDTFFAHHILNDHLMRRVINEYNKRPKTNAQL
jgi:hypothetical protein